MSNLITIGIGHY